MDIVANPFVKNGWSIKGVIEEDVYRGTYYLAEKNVGQDILLSRIWEHYIPFDEDKIQDVVNEKGSKEAAALYFRIILDAYVQNIKMQTEMSTCSHLLCPDEYVVVKQDNAIGWILYTRTRYCKTLIECLDGPIEIGEVIKFGRDICSALECCEQAGLGISYIGLDNLFRNDDEYLLGNLINIVTEEYYAAGGMPGTLLYMSPEMSRGQVDQCSAIYSLGLIMYWMLNDRTMPFVPKGSHSLNARNKAMELRLSGEAFPELPVPKELNDILQKACAANQKDRFQTAAEFQAALESVEFKEANIAQPEDILYSSEHVEPVAPNTVQSPKDSQEKTSFIGKIRKKLGIPLVTRDFRARTRYAADVFISYSSKDYTTASQIKEILTNNDISCWMAPESIPIGSDYANEIPDAVANCTAFVLLLTHNSQKSVWVPKELDLALTNNIPVLPFHLDQSRLTPAFNFKLGNVQRLEAFNNFSCAIYELIRRIQKLKSL